MQKSKVLQELKKKWEKIGQPKKVPKYTLDGERWDCLLEPLEDPNKHKLVKAISTGADLTENENIEIDQGEEEYKQTVSHWEFLAETIDGYLDRAKNCIYGPFTERQRSENPLLEGDNIMPHFIRETTRDDGTLKMRAVTNASGKAKDGKSFNDNVADYEKNLAYTTIVGIVAMIVYCKIKWLVMADAVNAFNRIPIDDKYVKYFGVRIAGFYFYWTCLTFGGASSCRIYAWFAAYVRWILVHYNQELFIINGAIVLQNYLDDFIAGHESLLGAWAQYYAILTWFAVLGIPTQIAKMCKPARISKYIGYILNLITYQLEIPNRKIKKAIALGRIILKAKLAKRKIRVRILQSFCGLVRFFVPVFFYLPPLLRSLEQQIGSNTPATMVDVLPEMARDIEEVIKVLTTSDRNKISFAWLLYPKNHGDIITETDASGKIGIGGVEKTHGGIYYKVDYKDVKNWPKGNEPDIVWLELCAVWIMHKLRGKTWKGKAILCMVDNQAVEGMMKKKKACFERKDLQALIRQICGISMLGEYWHWWDYINTKDNIYADGLSRNDETKEEVMKDLEHLNLKDKSKEALELVEEAIELYKTARKGMIRNAGEEKECRCNEEKLARCKDQKLYKKWKSNK